MESKKVNLGVVGIGNHGEKIIDAIVRAGNFNLSAVCHPRKEKADVAAAKYGCRAFYDLEQMLTDDVDAVAIITPNHLHAEEIKLCAKRGKHIFVEKPITNTLTEAEEAIAECQKAGIKFMVGHNFRRNGAIRKIKNLLENKKIGDFVSIEINLSHSGGLNLPSDNWRFSKEKCPGGSLMMLGVHAADTCNYLAGGAEKAAAIVKKLYAPGDDISSIIMELENGGVAYLCDNYNIPATFSIRIYGTNGVLEYDGYAESLTFRGKDIERKPAPLERIDFEKIDVFLEEMQEFGECILRGANPETGAKEGFGALAVAEAALLSHRENKFINIKKYGESR